MICAILVANPWKFWAKIELRAQNVIKRINFADIYVDRPLIYWRNILWSDECTFKSHPNNRNITFWTRYDDPYEQNIINPRKQQGGLSVMIWACFSYNAWGPLEVVDGYMKSAQYCSLMSCHMTPELQVSEIPLMFMQDGAKCHTSAETISFLNREGVILFGPWPPQCPDMNPIEWVWGFLKIRLQYFRPFPKTKLELIEAVMKLWTELTDEYRHKLVDGMPKRIQELKKRKGQWTMN
eukprot:NODE_422_length_7706_cov_0.257229.p4 type:complete len:238 gc:universal NODE_422_length_7706_cov_0.257229:6503-7216(+)